MNNQQDDWVNARVFYVSGGEEGKLVDSDEAVLGFCATLADYPDSRDKSIGDALCRYGIDSDLSNKLLLRAIHLLSVQTEWFRWPSLPIIS